MAGFFVTPFFGLLPFLVHLFLMASKIEFSMAGCRYRKFFVRLNGKGQTNKAEESKSMKTTERKIESVGGIT